jgi:Matrixin
MRRSRRVVIGVALIAAAFARAAAGSITLPLTLEALVSQADVVLLGRVVAQIGVADAVTGSLYTNVTIEPSEVFKGDRGDGPIVVKQQGGVAGSRGSYVAGQATFVDGEEVLLFLGTRDRDGSLFTLGLWQGKWTIEIDSATGQALAVKIEPQSRGFLARRALTDLRDDFARLLPAAEHRVIRPPADGALPDVRLRTQFVLFEPAIRWFQSPAVNIETGTQPGLASGGLAEIGGAIAQWNAAGSGLTLRTGTRLPPRCQESAGTDILVTFNDPCGEISSDPGVLATAEFGFDPYRAQFIDGRTYYPITDAVITTSGNPAARSVLTIPPCFQSVMAHEIGHAIGLDHTADPNALMYYASSSACVGGPLPLASDDLAGLFTIYPSTATRPTSGAPGRPTVTSAVDTGGALNVAWAMGTGAAAASHRLDFYSGGTLVATVPAGPGTSIAIPIPPGTTGTFSVQVTALIGAVASPSSTAFLFSIGAPPTAGCSSPPAPPVVTGSIVGGTATVSWAPSPGAMSYIVSAGSSPGATNLAPPASVGSATAVSASGLPAGFSAWVRVIAVNACGQSTPRDFFLSS